MRFLTVIGLVGCGGLPETIKNDDTMGLEDSGLGDTVGDSLDSTSDQNHAPVADAGNDVEGLVGYVVELDGSGSSDADGDALDYTWEITDAPGASSATLINGAFVDPQFIPDVEGVYRISLVVSDGALDSAADSITVTAISENGDPVADAGPDQSVTAGATVRLDGTGSADPDGDGLLFSWVLTSKPGGSVASLSSASTANPSFVADLSGSYSVQLTVSDGESYSSPDTVVVTASEEGGGDGGSGCGCHSGSDAAGAFTLAAAGIVGLLRLRRRR
jgi:MYXO-CTERM domain-containing protein